MRLNMFASKSAANVVRPDDAPVPARVDEPLHGLVLMVVGLVMLNVFPLTLVAQKIVLAAIPVQGVPPKETKEPSKNGNGLAPEMVTTMGEAHVIDEV